MFFLLPVNVEHKLFKTGHEKLLFHEKNVELFLQHEVSIGQVYSRPGIFGRPSKISATQLTSYVQRLILTKNKDRQHFCNLKCKPKCFSGTITWRGQRFFFE